MKNLFSAAEKAAQTKEVNALKERYDDLNDAYSKRKGSYGWLHGDMVWWRDVQTAKLEYEFAARTRKRMDERKEVAHA